MEKHVNMALAIVAGLLFFSCHPTELPAQKVPAIADDAKTPQTSKSKTYFLVVGKAKITDPARMQEKAAASVAMVADAAGKFRPGIVVDAVAESVMTKEQYQRGEAREKVTGAIFKERLTRLATDTTPQDTVVIYTHSHGRKNGFEESQPLGGIVMDLPVRRTKHRGAFLWDEYVDLLLKIPAKNVVVLTMSCYSGGLVEHLNSLQVRDRWKDRRQKQGRSLIVLTSQNKDLQSPPIVRNGEVINPFTYAVAKMLAGEADGFNLVRGKPAKPPHKDGILTVGEMIDYVLYTTEHTISEQARLKNIAKPQLTGSFNREDVLSINVDASGDNYEKITLSKRVEPTVKTPVESGNEQGSQAHP